MPTHESYQSILKKIPSKGINQSILSDVLTALSSTNWFHYVISFAFGVRRGLRGAGVTVGEAGTGTWHVTAAGVVGVENNLPWSTGHGRTVGCCQCRGFAVPSSMALLGACSLQQLLFLVATIFSHFSIVEAFLIFYYGVAGNRSEGSQRSRYSTGSGDSRDRKRDMRGDFRWAAPGSFSLTVHHQRGACNK